MKYAFKILLALVLAATLASCGTNVNTPNSSSSSLALKTEENNSDTVSQIKDNGSSVVSKVKDNGFSVVSKVKDNNSSVASKVKDNNSSVVSQNKENNSSVVSKYDSDKNNSSKIKENSSKQNESNSSAVKVVHEHEWGKWIHEKFPNPETGEKGISKRTCKICREIETKELTMEEVHHMFTTDGLIYLQ